jgi:hypothetical protein
MVYVAQSGCCPEQMTTVCAENSREDFLEEVGLVDRPGPGQGKESCVPFRVVDSPSHSHFSSTVTWCGLPWPFQKSHFLSGYPALFPSKHLVPSEVISFTFAC